MHVTTHIHTHITVCRNFDRLLFQFKALMYAVNGCQQFSFNSFFIMQRVLLFNNSFLPHLPTKFTLCLLFVSENVFGIHVVWKSLEFCSLFLLSTHIHGHAHICVHLIQVVLLIGVLCVCVHACV